MNPLYNAESDIFSHNLSALDCFAELSLILLTVLQGEQRCGDQGAIKRQMKLTRQRVEEILPSVGSFGQQLSF